MISLLNNVTLMYLFDSILEILCSFALKNEGDSHIRALAAQAMGVVGNQAALGDLIAALQDEDEQVRQAAAYSLNQIHQRVQAVSL